MPSKYKCAVPSCQKTGDRDFYSAPKKLIGQWLTSVGLQELPTKTARFCFRHFKSSELRVSGERRGPILGKTKMSIFREFDMYFRDFKFFVKLKYL